MDRGPVLPWAQPHPDAAHAHLPPDGPEVTDAAGAITATRIALKPLARRILDLGDEITLDAAIGSDRSAREDRAPAASSVRDRRLLG